MNPKIKSWSNRRVWIIGASSGIGYETAALLLAKGARVALSARRNIDCSEFKQAQNALNYNCDITNLRSLELAYQNLKAQWGTLDDVLIVAGSYQSMRAEDLDIVSIKKILDTNLCGVYNVLSLVIKDFIHQKQGSIGIVASVAGFRGLPKALAYGPSKAALINLAEILYYDLKPHGIATYLINPGFVATPMTAQNDFQMPALIDAKEAAQHIVTGIEQGQFHIHFPRRFTNWLRLLRLLPYSVYFKCIRWITKL